MRRLSCALDAPGCQSSCVHVRMPDGGPACVQHRTVKVICIDICMAPPSPAWCSPLKVPARLGARVVSNVTASSPTTTSATLPTLPGRAGLSRVRRCSRGCLATACLAQALPALNELLAQRALRRSRRRGAHKALVAPATSQHCCDRSDAVTQTIRLVPASPRD